MITLSSLFGVALATALAVNAIISRNEANQRKIQAESLLSYMVGDLRDSLTPIGRLDLLEGVGKQAMQYFAKVDVNDLTDGELLKQAQVLTQLGEIRFNQLQYDDALSSFTEAYERASTLYKNDPQDGERLFNRSQAEFWVGFTHWRSGDFTEAKAWLTRYKDSALGLIELDSSNTDWIREVGFGYHNLAVLDQEAGNLEASSEGFNRELETLQGLRDLDSSLSLRRDIADASSWLGNIAIMQGDLEGAREYYKNSMEEIERIRRQEPDNAVWLTALAFAVQKLAEAMLVSGQFEAAEKQLSRSMAIFDDLVSRDKNNTEWVRASTKPRISIGQLLQSRGQIDEAGEIADQAIRVLEEISVQTKRDNTVQEQLSEAYLLKSWVLQSENQIESALAAIRTAALHLEALQIGGRLDIERTGKLATIYINQAELHSFNGDSPAAQRSLQSAHDLLSGELAGAKAFYLLDPWARLLILDGRKKEGRQIIDELTARQYLPLKQWPD